MQRIGQLLQEIMKITRGQAIEQIVNLMQCAYYIPMCSFGNGGAGFGWISPNTDVSEFLRLAHDVDNYDFNVIPMDEIAEDFKENGINPKGYEVCVEFKEKEDGNPYTEQYLLWGLD